MTENSSWIAGTPGDCIEGISRLGKRVGALGAFGTPSPDRQRAPCDKMLRSYELLARYVMPKFQGSVLSTATSNRGAAERKEVLVSGRVKPLERAPQVCTGRGS